MRISTVSEAVKKSFKDTNNPDRYIYPLLTIGRSGDIDRMRVELLRFLAQTTFDSEEDKEAALKDLTERGFDEDSVSRYFYAILIGLIAASSEAAMLSGG